MKKLFLSLLLVLLTLVASAHDFEVDGIYYSIINSEKLTVEVTYEGTDPGNSNVFYIDNVVIPKTVTFDSKTYNVTTIGNYAFANCWGLTSVTIPNSVTGIGYDAFAYSGLTSVTIPNSITSIDDNAFAYCFGLTSVTIPNSVTSIDDHAFFYCSGLTSVTIPNSVTSIDEYAFSCCYSLTSITIPESVTSIAASTFYNCTSLPIENHVRYADKWALEVDDNTLEQYTLKNNTKGLLKTFYGCKNLTSITIPESVTYISSHTFYNCSSLTSVTIPNSVTYIGHEAFYKCSGLTSVTIPNSVTSIDEGTFSYCTSLTSITIPESVTSIATSTFTGCTSLPIENHVRYADKWALEVDDNTLEQYTLKNNTKGLLNTFDGCKNLTSITIPASVTSICGAFYDCSGLTEVHVSDIAAWCNIYFDGPHANPLYYAQHLYLNGKELTTLETLEGVTSIGDWAFCNCLGLTSVNIPNSVTYIGREAFSKCSGLTSVTIPNSVTNLRTEAFAFCSGLKSITIGSGVTIIPEGAFALCTNLTSITIPASVTQIEYGAFYGSTSLTDVYCLAEDLPATLSDVFAESNYENATLHVPAASVEEYRNTVPWSSFGNIIAIKQQLESTAITINQYGSGTYCSEYALDFTNVEGMKAYVGIGFNTRTNTLIMSPVRTVKPGVGLFIKGEPGVYNIPIIDSSDENYINLLVGTLNEVTVNTLSADGQYINYKYTIKSGEAEPMFYVFSNNSSLSANKAYLRLPTEWLPSISTAKNINIAFDNEDITGIDEFVIDSLDGKPVVYDLQGRRVINPKEGLYIVNGKKVLIK